MKKSLSWEIGEVILRQIVEIEENEIFSSFIPEATREHIKKIDWLYPNYADEKGELKSLVQSFLIESDGKKILVDTCNGNHKNRPNVPRWGNLNTNYIKKLMDIGVTPKDIDFVVCTHLHFDHVGWNTVIDNGEWIPTFPNAKYLFSEEEYKYWIAKPSNEMIDDFNGIDDSVIPIVRSGQAIFVPDDYRINQAVRLFPTPGHTPHHVSIEISSSGKSAIITGDVMHHPCQIAHQEWTTGADTLPEQTVETRKQFINKYLDTETLIIGSHFAYPVAGHLTTVDKEIEFTD